MIGEQRGDEQVVAREVVAREEERSETPVRVVALPVVEEGPCDGERVLGPPRVKGEQRGDDQVLAGERAGAVEGVAVEEERSDAEGRAVGARGALPAMGVDRGDDVGGEPAAVVEEAAPAEVHREDDVGARGGRAVLVVRRHQQRDVLAPALPEQEREHHRRAAVGAALQEEEGRHQGAVDVAVRVGPRRDGARSDAEGGLRLRGERRDGRDRARRGGRRGGLRGSVPIAGRGGLCGSGLCGGLGSRGLGGRGLGGLREGGGGAEAQGEAQGPGRGGGERSHGAMGLRSLRPRAAAAPARRGATRGRRSAARRSPSASSTPAPTPARWSR